MSKRLTLLLCALCCGGLLNAQSLWTDVSGHGETISGKRYTIPQAYRTLRLDLPALQALLANVPNHPVEGVVITLPMPDGGSARFSLYETPVMAPELQARYPQIRCYTGKGIDNPAATLKCDLTPRGFHAMVRSKQHGSIFIDPYAQGNQEYYISYFKKDLQHKGETGHFSCGVEREISEDAELLENNNPANSPVAEFQGDCQLRQYRLALACTREYSAFHGDTKPLVLAAMNTSMNRVNGLFENDLAVTMQLVANNDTLIFLSTESDPYSNNSGGAMLGQNVTTCNNRIGTANYDIGHVFSTGGGGIAGLGVVCTNGKARGVTGSDTPIGDGFDIDYVAHEMGHQFSANHTQNNNCGNAPQASMEPGSASTIMGYAGICAPNVQNNSDDYFHAISLQEIGQFITVGEGNTCPLKTDTGNNTPNVDGGANYTIPKSTSFALTAVADDANADALTYSWEQMDPQAATMPPSATSTTGPMFRSFEPNMSPTRYFPRLQDIVNNANPTWEKLPGAARTMNFRVTVRDNNALGGCASEDDVLITVAGNAGPFVVTEPNTNVIWYIGDSKTITWNVTNTNIAPVNCNLVRILLSTDGGFNYPVVLAESVPNTGSAMILTPDLVSNTCRVKVEAIGNVFFDISNQNFRIQPQPVPSFALENSTDALTICAGDTSVFSIETTVIAGFDGPVELSASGAPFGAVVEISPNPVAPMGTATVRITNVSPLTTGVYSLIIKGESGNIQQSDTVALTIFPGIPAISNPIAPADGSAGLSTSTTFYWGEVNFATAYTLQVSQSPAFSNFAYNQTQPESSATVSNLQAGAVYYWRVRTSNPCGDAAFSEIFSFQVQNQQCDQIFTSTDVPMVIDAQSINTALSVLDVPVVAVMSSVQVNMEASHSWVGDLSATIMTPWGLDIQLFDRPGIPATNFGCGNNNLNLSFSDQAALSAAVLESQCNNSNPALSGLFQPIQPLSVVYGQGATGQWRLALRDNDGSDDGGSLDSWSLRFCFLQEIPAGAFVHNNTLSVPQGGSAGVTNTYLQTLASGTTGQLLYTLLQLPQHGSLLLNGVILEIGGTFTQADIDANLLVYSHQGDGNLTDNFYFDVLDQNNAAWLHQNAFSIQVIQNNLNANVTLAQPLSCHNGADAMISVDASGLDGIYTYSLNGAEPQSSNLFSGLSAGTYSVVVTGQFGFTITAGSIAVGNPSPIEINTNVSSNSIIVTATGGTGALEYSLDGQNVQSEPVFTGLSDGIYTLIVRDANNCTATIQVIVANNSLLALLEASGGISCFGGNDGSIAVNAAGNQPPFAYSLNGIDFQPSPVFTGLEAGTYTVTVRDAGNMITTTNEVVLNQPGQLLVSSTVNINDISVVSSGGTPPYSLTINGIVSNTFAFADLAAGDYTFVVTDANGCTASTEATALGNTIALTLVAANSVSCNGDSDGIIGICVDGGIAPLSAVITPALGNYAGSTDNCSLLAAFSDLPPGEYSITITDAGGFSTIAEATVTEPEPIAVSASNQGDTIFVSATGGIFSYEYSLNGANWQASPLFPGLTDGNYTVFARDIKLCTDSIAFFLNSVQTIDLASAWGLSVSPNPGTGLFQLNMQQAPAALRGEVIDLTGRSLRRMDFTPGSGTFQTLIDVQDLPQGTYILRLTDGVRTGALRLSIAR